MKIRYFFLFSLVLSGCASYQTGVSLARRYLANGQTESAIHILAVKAEEESKDQVLYLMDYGLALHQAKDYKKSDEAWMKADRLAEVKDYVSLSRQAGSLLLNEGMIQYKSERFENLLINAYLALNFTLQGNFEDALVECRRIDEKIYKMKLEKENPQKNFYARYLSAMIWEAQGNWDSAYIDYKNAYKIKPDMKYFGEDLIRSAWRARRSGELKKWQRQFPNVNINKIKKDNHRKGELVFIYQQGWIPRKSPRPDNFRFPYLERSYSHITKAKIKVGANPSADTEMLYDVASEAIRTMNNEYKYLVAKKVVGIIAKEVVADQVRQKDEFLGAIAAIAMHASDQADLRQWSTLPQTFQLSRLRLMPGKHQVEIYGYGSIGEVKLWSGEVVIKKGKKTFITHRSFD